MTHEKITHIDLFSGIGGFALAADRVFGNVEHIFCDNEPFAQEVLKKHWPEAQIYGDIRTLTKDTVCNDRRSSQAPKVRGEWDTRTGDGERVHFVTGGFPCQPFSQAGRRRGEEDDRFLWPEMLRVIREFSPLWVIAENVRGLLTQGGGVVFERVCTDLEAAGYEVQPLVIPAVAVGAPHRRDRVWFVAHRTSERPDNGFNNQQGRHLLRNENRNASEDKPKRNGWERGVGTVDTNASDTETERSKRSRQTRNGRTGFTNETWRENWLEVATRLCTVDDGLPNGLARPKGWRNAALKGAGNAIVPQVAAQIMLAIKLAEEKRLSIENREEQKNNEPEDN